MLCSVQVNYINSYGFVQNTCHNASYATLAIRARQVDFAHYTLIFVLELVGVDTQTLKNKLCNS
jgi:hypothetical protein